MEAGILRLKRARALRRLHSRGLRLHAGEASVLLLKPRLTKTGRLRCERARLLLLRRLLPLARVEGTSILLGRLSHAIAAQERIRT